MLIVKIMDGADAPDSDARKPHRIITNVTSVVFAHTDKGGHMTVNYPGDEEEEFDLEGNVYVMNEAGKTISSFTPSLPVKSRPSYPSYPAKITTTTEGFFVEFRDFPDVQATDHNLSLAKAAAEIALGKYLDQIPSIPPASGQAKGEVLLSPSFTL